MMREVSVPEEAVWGWELTEPIQNMNSCPAPWDSSLAVSHHKLRTSRTYPVSVN